MQNRFDFYYERLLLLTYFFVLIEIALHMPLVRFLTPYKITLLLLGLLIVARAFAQGFSFVRDFFEKVLHVFAKMRAILIPLGLYLLFDLASLAYTQDKGFALTKYVTILSMLLLFIASAYYVRSVNPNETAREKIQKMLLAIGLTSVATCLYTYGYLLINGQTFYSRRLSMIEDYNQFSVVVIFGYFVLLLYLHRQFRQTRVWNLAVSLSSILAITVVTLSGSRRSFLMMLGCLMIPLLYEFILTLLEKEKKQRLIALGATVMIILIGTYAITHAFNAVTTARYIRMTEENQDIINMIGAKAVDDILTDENALSKRSTIWKMAIDAYKDFPLSKKLIGGGGSFAADLYDTPANKPVIDKMYWRELPMQYMNPHNFILVDLVSGGIVKTGLMAWSLISAFLALIKRAKQQFTEFVYLLAMSIIALGNIFISSKYGYLNDKFVWVVLILITLFSLELPAKKKEKRA